MRTVYLGTSEFAAGVLRALAASAHRPVLVLSRPDRPRGRGRRTASPPVVALARELAIPVLQPDAVNDPQTRSQIAAVAPERLIVCAFGALVREPLLSQFGTILNVHPSLLPRWRGAAPIERAILAGDAETGVSIMGLTAGLDSGPVYLQAPLAIDDGDDYGALAARLVSLGAELLVRVLDAAGTGREPRGEPQDDARATYAEKLDAEDRLLDPARPAAELARRVRALSPHVGARLELEDGSFLGVWRACPHGAQAGTDNGTIADVRGLPTLVCSDGMLSLEVVQPPGRRRSVTPARRCAYRVIRRVFEQGAFADRALHGEAQGLDARERAFATALAYGVVQRRRTLDHVLAPLCSRGLERVEAPVLAALRLGAHQLLLMGGVSEYAAVNESVELVNQERPRAGAFVNAVLRRVAREGRAALAALDDATPARAAVLHSVPDWLAGLWWQELGADEARALLARVNEPPESSLRVNTLREPDPGAVRARLAQAGVSVRPAAPWAAQPDLPELPEAVIVEGAYDVFASELWRDGVVMPQSRGSMVVARVLAPEPGQRVLDLCAAPGGKTTQLAALIGDRGELVAVELHPGRARALARTCERMAAGCVRVLNADGRELDAAAVEPGFDRVLVDPPCSGLGTLQIRPDLRWRARRASVEVLAQGQLELLDVAAAQLRPGGTLVYSVCTLTRAESGGVLEAFLTRHHEFTLERSWRLLPHREQTDGFFLARLTRAG